MTAALDLFAGTGWGVACQRLGIEEHGVEIMPEAVATRDRNGMTTVFRDVWDGIADPSIVPAHEILIASPPCQTFSAAGKGTGRKALDDVLHLVRTGTYADADAMRRFAQEHGDERTALVLVPLRYVREHLPTFVTFEQVPPVLPVWEACAQVLGDLGYSTATGIVNAEQHGVPQTRRRAVLVARRDGREASLPRPTHSRYYPKNPRKVDPDVLPWVSMADALGWGMTDRPYPTVATGTGGGGTDPAALGGSGARKLVYDARARGEWKNSGDADNDGGILRLTDGDAAVLQSYPPFRPDWAFTRPATTVAGDSRVWPPGHRINADDVRRLGAQAHERYSDRKGTGAYRATPEESASLQTYPDGFEFVGTRGRRFEQIGNAVPPLLAEAILRQFVLELDEPEFELLAP